jgi:hypothetical protein
MNHDHRANNNNNNSNHHGKDFPNPTMNSVATSKEMTLLEALRLNACGSDGRRYLFSSSSPIALYDIGGTSSIHSVASSQNSLRGKVGRSIIRCPYQKCKIQNESSTAQISTSVRHCIGCIIDEALMIASEVEQSVAKTNTCHKKSDNVHVTRPNRQID